MKDILNDFIKQGKEALKIQPFDFFRDTATDGERPANSVAPVYYLRWASSKNLLKNNNEIHKLLEEEPGPSEKAAIIRKAVGAALHPALFTTEGNSFTQAYYRPGWSFFYFTDISTMFCNIAYFEDIPDTEENYQLIANTLNNRLEVWRKLNSIKKANRAL